MSFKQLHLTKFRIRFPHTAKTAAVRKAWEKANVVEEWSRTSWAKKLALKKLRAKMTDFDRFKLMKAKQSKNRIINREMLRMKKSLKQNPVKVKSGRHAKKCLSMKKKKIAKQALKPQKK
uniref:Large ribosomal subunit protein eL14 n=1 Tax=Strigamia maritima TaxID=126957 RepID=T1JNX0_STRMM